MLCPIDIHFSDQDAVQIFKEEYIMLQQHHELSKGCKGTPHPSLPILIVPHAQNSINHTILML